MGVAAAIEIVVGIAHRLGTAAPEHDLDIGGFEAVILIAVNDSG
jgi:hypothetical protein